MTLQAYAKINLTLEVYGRRPDGYHGLKSVVAPISLCDTLDIEPTDDGSVSSDTGFPDDLCVKAAQALIPHLPSPISHPGAFIRVTKRIPVGGGLGGGSADAAATLRALNELWHLGKTPEELAAIGAAVGSDVPALVLAQHYRRCVLMEGRGEKVSLIPHPPSLIPHPSSLILANPGITVSTAEVYRLCEARQTPAEAPVNDLQEPAVRRHPEIGRTLQALEAAGAKDVRMSGSGATCYGFATSDAEAEAIRRRLLPQVPQVWTARLIETPPENRFVSGSRRSGSSE